MGLFGRSGFVKLPGHSKFSYRPRYYDPNEEEREERLKLKKGAFYRGKNKSRLVGAFSSRDLATESRRSKNNQLVRMLILIGLLALPIAYFLDLIGTAQFGIAFSLLFILFILRLNKL